LVLKSPEQAQGFFEEHRLVDKRFGSIVGLRIALLSAFQERYADPGDLDSDLDSKLTGAIEEELKERIPEIARGVASRLVACR
jgi:hypothetical protein